jgi:hypothetical protein
MLLSSACSESAICSPLRLMSGVEVASRKLSVSPGGAVTLAGGPGVVTGSAAGYICWAGSAMANAERAVTHRAIAVCPAVASTVLVLGAGPASTSARSDVLSSLQGGRGRARCCCAGPRCRPSPAPLACGRAGRSPRPWHRHDLGPLLLGGSRHLGPPRCRHPSAAVVSDGHAAAPHAAPRVVAGSPDVVACRPSLLLSATTALDAVFVAVAVAASVGVAAAPMVGPLLLLPVPGPRQLHGALGPSLLFHVPLGVVVESSLGGEGLAADVASECEDVRRGRPESLWCANRACVYGWPET